MRTPNALHAAALGAGVGLALAGCANAAPDDTAETALAPDAAPNTGDAATAPPTLPPPNAEGEREYTLAVDPDPPPPVVLDMNRDEVRELLGSVADEILLLELDSYPFLVNALEQVKNACGDAWRNDDRDPHLDCSLTELGRSFARDGLGWDQSPEYALVRLLTMSPSNSDVRGTSIEFLQGVSDFLGIGGGFAQMLADNLEIGRTEEFLDTAVVAWSLQQHYLGSHPGITEGGGIPFTLADALSDLSTLATKLGPTPDHPGVVAPGFVPHGVVLGPEFRMKVTADSNIRIFEGLSLTTGPGQVNVLQDRLGPNYDDPLEFDFERADRFEISGLADNPTVDLRIAIFENGAFVPACAGEDACRGNLPGTPVGPDSVWAQPEWQLEPIVAAAGVRKYENLVHMTEYVDGLATVEIGQGDAPPGWIHFGVPFNLGPKDQYAWELILEVAEVGMHGPEESRFAEGTADVAFTLTNVPVGITGAECSQAVRPYLQAQRSQLADAILGNFRERNDPVDFYLTQIDDGQLALAFVSPDDFEPGTPYPWRHPGFYATPDLAPGNKLSVLNMGGSSDTLHEKLLVSPGEQIVYVGDPKGATFRLRISPDPLDAFRVRVAVLQVQTVVP
jgi:hypothetical protein